MTQSKKKSDSVLWTEAFGFLTIIVLLWVSEALSFAHYFFDEPAVINLRRVAFRTLVVIIVWIWVHMATRRVLKRLHHLEEFVRVCGWCRKVSHEDEWISMEEYFGSRFATKTTHGICPACSREAFGAESSAAKQQF